MTANSSSDSAASRAPCVSVVIPSYNHEKYLQEAIDSVLGQTLADLELIIVDDGSSDGSWSLIEAAARRDPRVRTLAQANQGAHAAINAGMRESRGRFLAVLNSDDRFHPERLAQLVALAQAGGGLDFIATGLQLIDAEGRVIGDEAHPWLQEYRRMTAAAERSGLLGALLERNFTISTSNFFLRRSLVTALGPIRPYRYNMDWDYALRALLHAPERFAWCHERVLLDYRLHGQNTILGGLPVSAVEANHLVFRTLSQHFGVPARALARLRRHFRLIREQQVGATARARDATWEAELHKAHRGWAAAQEAWEKAQRGWEATRDAYDDTHRRLGAVSEELTAAQAAREEAQRGWEATRDAYDDTHRRLGAVSEELAAVRAELEAIRASRSYQLGMTLTRPVRWWRARRQAATPAVGGEGTPEPRYAPLALDGARDTGDRPGSTLPRVAVHLHIHYTELLDELLEDVAHLPGAIDLFVTTTQPVEAVAPVVHGRFPLATVWRPENRGKDVGPFIDALQRHRLDKYDLVLKLHGKKSLNLPGYLQAVRGLFGADIGSGDDWRRGLIAPLTSDSERVRQIYRAFAADPSLGMVGAARFICRAPDADPAAYARLCERLGVSPHVLFFGGTMFWVRGAALRRLVNAGLRLEEFRAEDVKNVESTLEHACERVFGTLAAAEGYWLGGVA